MKDYEITNCKTSDPATFRGNVMDAIEILKANHTSEYDQIVLQREEENGIVWNFFIYMADNGRLITSWQKITDGVFLDFDLIPHDTAEDVLVEIMRDGGYFWKSVNLIEIYFSYRDK